MAAGRSSEEEEEEEELTHSRVRRSKSAVRSDIIPTFPTETFVCRI